MNKSEMKEINEILKPAIEPTDEVVETEEATDDAQPEEENVEDATEEESISEESGDEAQDENDEEAAEVDESDKKYTPTELAEAIGWETEDLYSSVMIPMKDGESVPLGEFKNKYQDLSHENTQLQAQLEEAKTNPVEQTQQLSAQMIEQMGMMQQIQRAEESTDWEELEELDPTEAILKRDKIRRAKDEVQANIQQIQLAEQTQRVEMVKKAEEKLLDMVPEWKDAEVRSKDEALMRQTALSYDYTDNEIMSIADPRLMKLLRRLSHLESREKQASSAVEKVRKAPRRLKGQAVSPINSETKINKLVSKAKQSGDRRDEYAAIKALLQQG